MGGGEVGGTGPYPKNWVINDTLNTKMLVCG